MSDFEANARPCTIGRMKLLDHPRLTDEGRKSVTTLIELDVRHRLQLVGLRIERLIARGPLGGDTPALVARLEAAWSERDPKLAGRMRLLDTLTVLGEVLDEIAPSHARSPSGMATCEPSPERSEQLIADAGRYVDTTDVKPTSIANEADAQFFSLTLLVFAVLHPDLQWSDRLWEAVDVVRRGPGPRPSARAERKWEFLAAMVKEVGLGSVEPNTLRNEYSAWTTGRSDSTRLEWTRFMVRGAAGLKAEVPKGPAI